ncbi:protein sidekick-2 isoform X2 [Eurytemora carolleeae]|uniref:protein sidekick-2 isoform X2 n=1 Tax=Eurytemora carolleeae TaxID=1294199 RepID=UPI000C793839|nr:protein sidekick-2 isoform X2 [Eurytemora carolleeae]|eukprot:XP_023344068.1 protein sidekick-2-like isoform X2 [Eurytemora affinis]
MYVLSVLGVLGLVLGVGGQEDCKTIDIDIGSTWLNISWLLHCEISPEDVLFVRSYHVKLEDVSTGYYNYTLNVFCTRTSCTQYIENLRSCIKYNVSLQAEMDDGELFDYNSQEIVLKEELPSTPQNLLISDETSSSLQVSWVPPQEGEYCVHHYKVYLNDLTSNQEYQVSLETEELSLEIKELQACVGYGVTVTPVTGSGNEGRMVSTSGATSFENPSRPSQLRPKDSGSNYVSFYWVPGSNYSSCLRGTSALCVQSEFQDQPAG